MRIVDFHSHFFSRPFFDALAELSPRPGTVEEKLAALSAQTGIELPSESVEAHTDRWLGELDAHGVEHMVSFASLPPEAPALSVAKRHAAGRLSTMALVDPSQHGTPERVANLMDEGGFSGLLVFPAMHHFELGGSAFRSVLEVVSERRGIVFVHCGLLVVKLRDLLGLPRPYDLSFANPLSLIPAANAFPQVSFVIPHFGAGFFREALMCGTQCENVHVDSSSTNSWIRTQPGLRGLAEVFERSLEVFGAERVLFGTDSTVFPAGWQHARLNEQRAVLAELGLAEGDQRKILAENALRLLGRVGA